MSQRIVPESMKSWYESLHFAPAVIDGNHVRCSGMIGVDLGSGVCPKDPAEQFDLAFKNLGDVLNAAETSFSDVLEMTTFHVGLQTHLEIFLEIKDQYLTEPYPAWTAIGVSELAISDAIVEIRVTATK